jgi:endonuclease G
VTIIQHPLGGTKQIALTANKIIGIDRDRHKLFYQTDTEPGSSGSPVFNNEWKVIALHHAGKTESDGGLVIDVKTGEKRGANEGILIKEIVQNIGKTL